MLSVLGLKVVARPGGKALVHGAIAGGTGFGLGYRDEQRIRRIDGQDIARARAGVVHIADTETAADHGPGSRRIGEANTWTKVSEVRIHQGFAVDATGRNRSDCAGRCITRGDGQHRLRNGIKVREQVVLLPNRANHTPSADRD